MHAADIRAWATEQNLHVESPIEPSLDHRTDPLAVFDHQDPAHRTYRYVLTRCWDPTRSPITYAMLNPSTAGALHHRDDDRTISRCRDLARAAGYGGMIVVNLFALITKDPLRLARHPDPVGPANDALLDFVSGLGDSMILAWGTKHSALHQRSTAVLDRLTARGQSLLALGLNTDGSPKHPLYLSGATRPLPFSLADTSRQGPDHRPRPAEAKR